MDRTPDVVRLALAAGGALELWHERREERQTIADDVHGETWVRDDGRVRCRICKEDGAREGNTLTAQEGWTHLATGVSVCTDCVTFPEDEIGRIGDDDAAQIFEAINMRDTAAVQKLMDAVRDNGYGGTVN